MMHKRAAAAWLLAMVLLFSGCSTGLLAPKDQPVTEPVLAAGKLPAYRSVGRRLPPALEELPLELEGGARELVDAGSGRVILLLTPGMEGTSDWSNAPGALLLIDTAAGQVCASQTLLNADGLSLQGVRKNGELVVRNFNSQTLDFYDAELKLLRSVEIPQGFSGFEREKDALYCTEDNRIDLLRLPDMERQTLLEGLGIQLAEADFPRDRLLLQCRSARDGIYWDYCLYDLAAGTAMAQDGDGWGEMVLAGDCMLRDGMIYPETDGEQSPSGTDPHFQLEVFDAQTGLRKAGWHLPYEVSLYTDPGTASALAVRYAWAADDGLERSQFYLVDPLRGKMQEITRELGEPSYLAQCYLPSGDCWVVAASSGDYPHETTKLFLLRPEQIRMETELAPGEPAPEQPLHEAGAELQQLRQRADEIEQTYGVRILLGDECLDMSDNGSYTLISVTDESAYAAPEDGVYFTASALDCVEQALAFYPEGFFRTFRDFRGEGGLRIALVANLENRFGEFQAGGIHYTSGAWYNIVLDADNLGARQTVHHEMWHACESRINDAGLETFQPDNWNPLNPPGFEYTQNFETYYQRTDINRYLMGWSDDPWFAQTYSTVTPMEDRSTLVETMLQDYYDPEFYGFETSVAWVCSYPHLRAKVQAMHDAVEQVFGVCYWEMP